MVLKIWNKWKLTNEIIVFEKDKFMSKNINLQVFQENEIKLKKWEDFKIKLYTEVSWKTVKNIILVKIKKLEKINSFIEPLISNIWNQIKSLNKNFFLNLDKVNINIESKHMIEELFMWNLYTFDKYFGNDKKSKNKYWLIIKEKSRNEEEFENMKESIYIARDLINEPNNYLTTVEFEKFIKDKYSKDKNIKIRTIVWNDLQKQWLNGVYSVWQWSINEPRLIILEYKWSKNKQIDFWMIWKWVCYDTWWYNIKPTWYMEWEKSDMWWAASILWTFNYMTKTKSSKNIVVALPIVENVISQNAYKPWDIIKLYNWKTVEIQNTDAEWRLILWDWLSYVEKNYNPNYIFDMATLTWAQIIALWFKITAIMWNNKWLNKKIQDISWKVKERTWELPLFDKYFESYDSDIADFKNLWAGKYNPGCIGAWLFLKQFVDNKNWVHFDIAWPSWNFISSSVDELYWTWSTWHWVRLLINVINNL